MGTRKRIALSLSIFVVLMGITAAITFYYVNNSTSGLYAENTSSYSQLNCSSGYYQLNDKCVPDDYGTNATSTSSSQSVATNTAQGGCFGCVFITAINVAYQNPTDQATEAGNQPAMPSDCMPGGGAGWSSSPSQLSASGMSGSLSSDGSALEVIGPGVNGAQERSFTYEFYINLAYGVQSDGTDCSMGMYVNSISLSNAPNGVTIQSVTPSTPYDIANIGDQGGSQNFYVTFTSLDGNYYSGALDLVLHVASDGGS